MSKPAVLCIARSFLETMDINKPDISAIPEEEINFINRKYADSQDITLGYQFPQVIPVILFKCGDEYLTYERVGSEERLHKKFSLSVGGHIDIHDALDIETEYDAESIITDACSREAAEEVNFHTWIKPEHFKHIINTPVDDVSSVHVGFVCIIELNSKDDVKPSEEIPEFRWLTKPELFTNLPAFEAWGQYIINKVI